VHFDWVKGATLNRRYRIRKLLGDGTFGRVLLADDQNKNRQVAIKVIRDIKRYAENAKIEADILKDIRREDPRGEASRSAIMYETFTHEKHYCLVFEPCGPSLYDFIKRNSFRGFWMQDIQGFASQSLSALGFLHQKLKMTHTDLKPENILLESLDDARESEFPRQSTWKQQSKTKGSVFPYTRPTTSAIRLIDFGNATYEDAHHSSIINTRQYRGPEVILSLGWNERSDIWSMGCILMELYTGELLFGTHENLEHLALMEQILEPLPRSMLDSCSRANREKYVAQGKDGQLRLPWPEKASGSKSEKHVKAQRPLAEMVVTSKHKPFADFVGHLLTLDPAKRPSANEALKHSFFSMTFTD
jgi:dual-specificity kinase